MEAVAELVPEFIPDCSTPWNVNSSSQNRTSKEAGFP